MLLSTFAPAVKGVGVGAGVAGACVVGAAGIDVTTICVGVGVGGLGRLVITVCVIDKEVEEVSEVVGGTSVPVAEPVAVVKCRFGFCPGNVKRGISKPALVHARYNPARKRCVSM